MKSLPSKALIIKINLVFLVCFLVAYAALLHWQLSSVYHEYSTSPIKCTLCQCHHKVEAAGIKMNALLEESIGNETKAILKKMVKHKKPSFVNEIMGRGMKIGMVNMEGEHVSEWRVHGQIITVQFQKVSELLEWNDLFPGQVYEELEEMDDRQTCPEIPMPPFYSYSYMDIIVVKLPCNYPQEGWRRDVLRLQVHLVAANLAVKRKKGKNGKMKLIFLSKCRPMMEIFRCKELKRREGDWWYYEPNMAKLEQKVSLPIGSCKLALSLREKEINEVSTKLRSREAYATILHSSGIYVCGAITLAQSLLRTGTKRDLILLLDEKISEPKRDALIKAGWKLRFIKRIRNTRAEKNSYNEYNYSKFRLWQITDYDKIIFIDADIIVLRNIDLLFHFPQLSATGNAGSIFNSGVMVIEPSNCTFNIFMQSTKDIISYNGGDQGFLNEIFVWWHRLPRRVNYFKNFENLNEVSAKNQLFKADPPQLYAIHYLGLKPWVCYRDYDCNWDVGYLRVYASDVAHKTWWKLHDAMDEKLQKFCGLTSQRKTELYWSRKKAEDLGLKDEHWRINITDPRRLT
ncbi:UDP-glucuronate:xylan alpha-glucuronosyltransferase 2-like [Lycium ferocissimum]|uniref:UDP-glucuronate:xylan alpha-glucuronosyltransferase 2-like n=1 Tax=Lycium ferocissimum TaxID=112874 RepID=UPI0028166515|nr:UDP-glucuronate:xylan alpha-glucuronosyltransferase 2-like [Lycium ferocissimum]